METIEKKQRGGKRSGAGRPHGALQKTPKKNIYAKKYNKLVSCNTTLEEYNFIKECAEKEGLTVYSLVKTAVFTYLKTKRYCPPDDKL